jgi:hypothetical protein
MTTAMIRTNINERNAMYNGIIFEKQWSMKV